MPNTKFCTHFLRGDLWQPPDTNLLINDPSCFESSVWICYGKCMNIFNTVIKFKTNHSCAFEEKGESLINKLHWQMLREGN